MSQKVHLSNWADEKKLCCASTAKSVWKEIGVEAEVVKAGPKRSFYLYNRDTLDAKEDLFVKALAKRSGNVLAKRNNAIPAEDLVSALEGYTKNDFIALGIIQATRRMMTELSKIHTKR
jgi:hypothetical protein